MRWNRFKTWKLRLLIRSEVRKHCRSLTREELDETLARLVTIGLCRDISCYDCIGRDLEIECFIFHEHTTINILASELKRLRKRAKTDEQKYGSMPL